MKPCNKVIAARLQQALAQSGIKQQELANKSGVAKASISQYVHGKFAPSSETAVKLAYVLKVSPAWLMGFDVPMFDFKDLSEEQTLRLYEYYIKLTKENKE